jgi:hypothetical protein
MRTQLIHKGEVVYLQPRTASPLLRLVDKWLPMYANGWATMRPNIYHPRDVAPLHLKWDYVVEHELVHIDQQRRWTLPLFLLLYILAPLPIGCAWFRARWECAAFAKSVVLGYASPEYIVNLVASMYVWPLPKWWLRRMLASEVKRIRIPNERKAAPGIPVDDPSPVKRKSTGPRLVG